MIPFLQDFAEEFIVPNAEPLRPRYTTLEHLSRQEWFAFAKETFKVTFAATLPPCFVLLCRIKATLIVVCNIHRQYEAMTFLR